MAPMMIIATVIIEARAGVGGGPRSGSSFGHLALCAYN